MFAVAPGTLQLDVDVAIERNFDFLSAEYRALFNVERATAFQSPLWMDAIHRRLAPKLHARQHTLTVRDRRFGTLLALVPLVLQRVAGLTMAAPADFGVCDYNAAVGDPAILENLAADSTIVDRIGALLEPADILLFRKLLATSFDVSKLLRMTKSSPSENAAYYSEIGDDFEEWQRRTLRRKFTKELCRLGRQVEREFGAYTSRPAANEEEIRAAFAALRSFRTERFESDLLERDLYFDFYVDYAIRACRNGEAILYVSYVASKPVAVLFGLTGGADQFHAMLIGADTGELGKFSLGTQIIYRVIKSRFDDGQRRFDMGLGNTGYKSQFRVEETPLRNCSSSHSVAGSAFAFIYHHAKPLKEWLQRYVPHVR